MVNLELDDDEGIILEADNATRVSGKRTRLEALVLTNKKIYVIYKQSHGFMSKATTEVEEEPLEEIKIINGEPLVKQVRNSNLGFDLQIQFISGLEQFEFSEATKKTTGRWKDELYKLLVGHEAPRQESAFKKGFSDFASGMKDVASSAAKGVTITAKQVADQAGRAVETSKVKQAQMVREKSESSEFESHTEEAQNNNSTGQENRFCSYCGTKLVPGTRFCPGCGKPVGVETPQERMTPPPIPQSTQNLSNSSSEHSERSQGYAGVVLKCPNCGAPIGQTTVICPVCGYHITGRSAVSSVKRFSDELMQLESNRKTGFGQILGQANPVDVQKLSLIKSFPIPNTIDDIQEFVMLAIANIDTKLSKNSIANKYSGAMNTIYRTTNSNSNMPKLISDAWVAKLRQAYEKAKISFPDEPSFSGIKEIYIEKMHELKIKIREDDE